MYVVILHRPRVSLSRYLSSALIKSAASATSAKPDGRKGGGEGGGIDSSVTPAPPGPTTPRALDAADDNASPAHIEVAGVVEGKEKEGGGDSALISPLAAGIRRLLLTGNRLGDAGARALASALKKDRSLEVLDLSRYCCCRSLPPSRVSDALDPIRAQNEFPHMLPSRFSAKNEVAVFKGLIHPFETCEAKNESFHGDPP